MSDRSFLPFILLAGGIVGVPASRDDLINRTGKDDLFPEPGVFWLRILKQKLLYDHYP